MNADNIKVAVASYYRYKEQSPVVAFEASAYLRNYGSDMADVLVLRRDFRFIEVEAKISMSDFHRDKEKLKHRFINMQDKFYLPNYFYFAVPVDLANKVSFECDQLFTYAGVIGVRSTVTGYSRNGKDYSLEEDLVTIYRRAKLLHPEALKFVHIASLVKHQSGTLCRLARDLEKAKEKIRNYQELLKEDETYAAGTKAVV